MNQPSATQIVPVVDLIGQPVAGRIAWVAGCVDHPEHPPMWRRLKTVERRMERVTSKGPKVEWVYWTWEAETASRDGDCGYSGMTVEYARRLNRCLTVEAAA